MAKKKSKSGKLMMEKGTGCVSSPQERVAHQPKISAVSTCAEKNAQAVVSVAKAPPSSTRASLEEKASSGRKPSSAPKVHDAPMVLRSTMYMAVLMALVVGLFAGTLLPGLMGHSLSSGSASAPAQSAAQSPAAQTSSEQEKNIARLAGHIQELESAVRKNPEDVKAWVQLGNLYFDTGKASAAVNAYERALLLKPDAPDVLTDLGIMYRETGKHDLAVQSFRKATMLNPKHENALFNTGVVLLYDLGRKGEAREAWQQLLKINPKAVAPNGKPVTDLLRNAK